MLWVGLQCVNVVFPDYAHYLFKEEFNQTTSISLRATLVLIFALPYCIRCMVFVKCSNELANFTNSTTEAEEIYWTKKLHVYSLHKTGFENN